MKYRNIFLYLFYVILPFILHQTKPRNLWTTFNVTIWQVICFEVLLVQEKMPKKLGSCFGEWYKHIIATKGSERKSQ